MRGVRRLVGNVVFYELNVFRHSCCFYYLGTYFVFTPQMFDYLQLIKRNIRQLLFPSSLFLSSVFVTAALLPQLSCVHPSASSQLPCIIFTHDNLSGGTLGQFEGLVWPDFTCRRIYERCGGAMAHWYHWYTYITGSLTGVLSDVCLSWIGNGSNLVAWDECAGWTEWVHSTCQAHRTMTVSHHCCFFQPWPLTPPPPLVSSGWDSEGKPPAGWQRSEMCVCQQPIVRESACHWNLWCLPTLCSTGRARRRATTVKCMVRRAWRSFLHPSHPHIEI